MYVQYNTNFIARISFFLRKWDKTAELQKLKVIICSLWPLLWPLINTYVSSNFRTKKSAFYTSGLSAGNSCWLYNRHL